MDNRLYTIVEDICNPEYRVIQNSNLITRVIQPMCNVLGVEVPVFEQLVLIFNAVDKYCGSGYSSAGCDPWVVVQVMRDHASGKLIRGYRSP